jgi:hypothetical protein
MMKYIYALAGLYLYLFHSIAIAASISTITLTTGAAPIHVVVANQSGTPIAPSAVTGIQSTGAMAQCTIVGDTFTPQTGWNLSCPATGFSGTGTIVFSSQGYTTTLTVTVVGASALSGIEVLQQ